MCAAAGGRGADSTYSSRMLPRVMALLLLGCLLLAAAPQPTQSFTLLGYEISISQAAAAAAGAAKPAAQTPETAAAKKAQAAQLKGAAQSAIAAAVAEKDAAAANVHSASTVPSEVRFDHTHCSADCNTAQNSSCMLVQVEPSQSPIKDIYTGVCWRLWHL